MYYIKACNYNVLQHIKKNYDAEFTNITQNNVLYDHIVETSDKIITFGDFQVCNITIMANIQKDPNIKILYISDETNIHPPDNIKSNKYLSSIIKKIEDNIIFIGVKSSDEFDVTMLIKHVTQKKLSPALLKNLVKDDSVHVCLNIKYENVIELLHPIKNNIKSIDIFGFENNESSEYIKKTCEYTKNILINIFDVKEKKINIFNEQSEFLIYRPCEQIDIDCDYGWYILKGIDNKYKSTFLQMILGDSIKEIVLDGDKYLISKTTIDEQNSKSIYSHKLNDNGEYELPTIRDRLLFPSEKSNMVFDLLE